MNTFITHSPVGGHLGCFYNLPVVNDAAVNMECRTCFSLLALFQIFPVFPPLSPLPQPPPPDSISFWSIPRSKIAGSYDSSIFNFLRNFHTVFHNACRSLHSHQQCLSVFFPSYPCQQLLSFVFLIIHILIGMRWYLTVVLICISVMISGIEHLFIYLLAICMSSFEYCLLKSFAYF